MTEYEMAEWHHQLNAHGFWPTLGVGDGQGALVLNTDCLFSYISILPDHIMRVL